MLIVFILLISLPHLCLTAVVPPFPARDCVKVRVTVQDPNNQYYTNVIISGENTCDKTYDLTGASIAYDSNHAASQSAWGTGGFATSIPAPTFTNNTVRWYLGSTSPRPALTAKPSITVSYGVSLNGHSTLNITNARLLPPPYDNGVVKMFIQKSALLLRDVYVTLHALDKQVDEPIRVLLHNMSVDRNHDLKGLMYGRYEITVS